MKLRYATPNEWSECILDNFDEFLVDHAAAEKKASGMAMSMALHYRDRDRLVKEMIDLSIEELQHFRECVHLLQIKGIQLAPDERDVYVHAMRNLQRQGKEEGLLDRLLVCGIIEARGCERFGLVHDVLPTGEMKSFYKAITDSENKHQNLFVELASEYFSQPIIEEQLDRFLDQEAKIIENLPIRAKLH